MFVYADGDDVSITIMLTTKENTYEHWGSPDLVDNAGEVRDNRTTESTYGKQEQGSQAAV
jgi:hypothetical protein